MRNPLVLGFFCAFLCSGCIPDVYLIDRQTVLELEASGEWTEMDLQFKKQSLSPGPQALETTHDRIEQRQIFSMTHSDSEPKPKQAK